jgi:hypothetical protein
MKKNGKENAYLTIYLALIFGVVLSLLLALIEGAAIGAVRLQSEIVADLGLDSVFAEYNRELLDQYGLFFIDTSYGTVNGGVGMVEKQLSDYMLYNMDPRQDKTIFYLYDTYLYLCNPQLEIEKITYATDDDGIVWKSAAVNYMKAVFGGDIVSEVQDNIAKVEENGLTTRDVVEELREKKNELDKEIEEKMIEEYGEVQDKGYIYDKVSSVFDDLVGGTIINWVTPSGDKMSSAVVEGGPYYSVRAKNGNINKGSGIHEGVDKASGIIDEFIYNEYLMTMCGTYTNPKDEGQLKYQMEYILYGCNSDEGNMKNLVERLFALRLASNMMCIYNDSSKKNETEAVVTIICTFIGFPEIAEPLTDIILGIMALAESFSDIKVLLDNGRVPLTKSSGDWNVNIWNLINGKIINGEKNTNGLTYNDYLRIFVGMMDKNEKLARSLDIVEMDIRKTDGNSGFRIDRCADYIRVQFGFSDGNGHDFLFTRSKCYD